MVLVFFSGLSGVSAETNSKSIAYACTADTSIGEIPLSMNVEFNSTVQKAVDPNSEFTIEDSNTVVTIDESHVPALKLAMSELNGKVTTTNLVLENATNPEDSTNIINVADPEIAIENVPIPESGPVVFQVPNGEGIDLNILAGESGEVKISAGQIVTVLEATGPIVTGEITATCDPDPEVEQDTTLNVISIEEPEPVDEVAPVIELLGDNPMELEVGDTYVDPGATATDDVDGDISDQIVIDSSNVDTSTVGMYTVTYNVTDAAGNAAEEVTRTVNVVEPVEEPEEPVDNGGTWHVGDGEPAEDLGEVGDLYLDRQTFNVYEKTENGWVHIGKLQGEDGQDGEDGEDGEDGNDGQDGEDGIPGEDGATWLVGEGEPNVELGEYGDLYLDTTTGDVYLKGETSWELVANLQGPPGENGEDGEDGQDGKDGEDGEDGQDGECGCEEDNDEDGTTGDSDKDDSDKAESSDDSSEEKGGKLPDTATNTPLFMLLGSLMAAAGGVLFFLRKKAIL